MAGIPRVVILGGGFGGLSTAVNIRDRLGASRVRVTLVDRKDWFMVGFAKLWIIRGTRTFEESIASLENLSKRDISFVKSEILGIDLAGKVVETAGGRLDYDYLVVALGARLSPQSIPGLEENGLNLYDHDQLATIRERLLSLESGSVAVAIMGMPYKCPPAPFEAAMLVSSLLRELGVRDTVSIDVYSPAPITLPAAGPEISGSMLEMIQSENIRFHGFCKTVSVDPGRLNFQEGGADYDILLAVPPHTVPEVVSELAGDDPFIRIDRFGRTRMDSVYAIGDVTMLPAGKAAVPKAGIFAEGEGLAVARSIVSDILPGEEPEPFDGRGGCFIESGRGTASIIDVDAFVPSTSLSDSTKDNLAAKIRFEKDRLEGWLG